MSDNKPMDPIAEFQKLRLETAGMSDKLTNTFQLADSRRTSNIEVLKGLDGIRKEIQEMREEGAEDKKKQETQANRLLEDLEASRAANANSEKNSVALTNEIGEMKQKLTHQELMNGLILAELRAIRKEVAMMKSNVTQQSIVEEIIGEWVLVSDMNGWMDTFRKFERNDDRIEEFCSHEQIFSDPSNSIHISKTFSNRLIDGDKSYYIENTDLHISDKGDPLAIYRKII